MAINKDITEELPYVLGNSVISTAFASGDINYDIAISGVPFILASSDATPYRRDTAPYRKQQIDQSNEPGEQTLTGWWLRSQASFHNGCGIKYVDPTTADDAGKYRFADSRGVDVWTKGQVSLLKSTIQGHNVTTAIDATTGRATQHLRSIKSGTADAMLLLDGYDVDKIDNTGTQTHYIEYVPGTGVYPVYAICDDGKYAYWVTNKTSGATTKLTMFKKPLSGDATNTADEVQMFQDTAIISNATMEYVKDRIVLCADNKVYEISPAATALPAPVYTHPSSTYIYTDITASGPAIYVTGYNGIQSTINKFTLSSAGAMPTLTSAVTAAELPVGEIVHRIYYYLGRMLIGTSKGIRAADISATDGSLTYGPLIVETTQPCYDFAARDKFAWCATSVAGEPGLIRIDLSNEIETLRFAWAYDIYYPGVTGHATTACAFVGDTTQLGFATAYNGSNGYVYVSSLTDLISTGYITTGRIRYSTLEPKAFKFLKALVDNSGGSFSVSTISPAGNEYSIGSVAEDDVIQEFGINNPSSAQEYLSFKFILNRSITVNTTGAVFSGYQVKSLPSLKKQRLIQFAVSCYDHHTDTFGNQVGYEGMAYDKLSALEALEDTSDTVRIEDFRTGESFLGLIEQAQFTNPTPSDKLNSGFGGVILVTVRKL